MKKSIAAPLLLILCFWSVLTQAAVAPKPSLKLIDVVLNHSSSNRTTGGGSIGGFGGGDTTDQRKLAAWFYGQAPIDVCYSLNKSFGLTEPQVEETLLLSFKTWTQYFKNKQINKEQPVAINTNFKLKGKCQGGEDLVIYLGTGPIFQNLLDLKAFQGLSKPLAYVNKTHLSDDHMWSKGYIRFVESFSYSVGHRHYPDWSQLENFSQLLIHEIGHVLGFTHTPETIMTSLIVKDLFIEETKYPRTIDFTSELYICDSCEVRYQQVETKEGLFKSSEIISREGKLYLSNATSQTEVKILNIEKKKTLSPLISIFETEEKTLSLNSIYFINHKNQNFVIIKETQHLKVFKDGVLVALFKRTLK